MSSVTASERDGHWQGLQVRGILDVMASPGNAPLGFHLPDTCLVTYS